MAKEIENIDSVMSLLNMPGVHVRLRDKNALRERYCVRRDGDNAFERTDVAITASFVCVEDYDSLNQSRNTAMIMVTNMISDQDKKLLCGKISNLQTRLRGMAELKHSGNGK